MSEEGPSRDEVSEIFGKIEKKTVRRAMLMVNLASMEEIQKPYVISASRLVCWRERMGLLLPAANSSAGHNHLGSMRMLQLLMRCRAHTEIPLCSITTSLLIVLGKLDSWAGRSAVRLVMVVWHGGVLLPFYQKLRTGRTPRGWYRKSLSPMVLPQWHQCVAQACP